MKELAIPKKSDMVTTIARRRVSEMQKQTIERRRECQ